VIRTRQLRSLSHFALYLKFPCTRMRIRIPIALLCLSTLPHAGYSQSIDEIVVGSKYSIQSDVLGEARDYWVDLPDTYDLESSSHVTYPLLVVLDGQAQFEFVSSMLGYMSRNRSDSRRVPEMIVVGVASTNRERDFTPDKIVTRRKNDTGGADQFLAFLENELMPVLRDSYRLSSFDVLMGHSLGGLFAVHTYLKPETAFDAFISIDPSFGTWDDAKMDGKVESATDASFDRFLYIATANWGARNLGNRDRHIRFYEALHKRVGDGQFRARIEYFEDENHLSVPIVAFHNGLSAMFEGYGMTFRDVTSLDQMTAHYGIVSDRLSHDFVPPEGLVNRVGYRMLQSDDDRQRLEALDFFKMNAANFPESFNAFDSLGEAYAALGQKSEAIASYRKSLELNPDNQNAAAQIEILSEQ